MNLRITPMLVSLALVASCGEDPPPCPPRTPAPAAISFLGEELHRPEPSAEALEKYEQAKLDRWEDPGDVEKAIWYGRRAAYLGLYAEAITTYRQAIEVWPEDARLYRHRGHRYISTRRLDRAIADFERAAELIEGQPDEIEPDGMPNARNIPVSSLHTNVWYHLGLAHYLKGEYESAVGAYRRCLEASNRPDNLVSTAHWLYMALRRLGRDDEAATALESIDADMDVIENMAYHQLCLFYKGEIGETSLTGIEHGAIMNAAAMYGLGNWHLAEGRTEKAREIFEALVAEGRWAAFGHIAAEADLARGLE